MGYIHFENDTTKNNYLLHKRKWSDCSHCSLCESRNKVVLFRGCLPAPLLFIGEAPGESEDALGYPFVGAAGRLLNDLLQGVEMILSNHKIKMPKYGITNIVSCWPNEDNGNETSTRIPSQKEVKACSPRLQELIKICNPSLIAFVGKTALQHGNKLLTSLNTREVSHIGLIHPAAILRMPSNKSDLEIKRFTITLAQAIRKNHATQKTKTT